ncbi:hypothetical protein NFI96_028333 [Prochilodus magdalenae]|nr:hypothetical protein NFI96_028333 [Prochilodus magdalenae]
MESTPGEVDGNTEDLTELIYYLYSLGRKKSRFKFLKTRLFGRLKKKETEGQIKQSKSTSDVTTRGGKRGEDDSEDDCQYPPGTLSSRALSHDSIFLADQSSEPKRVLSQENVHSRIKALQMKLQQQNMRLGPPPFLIPGKRIEDSGTMSEDDGLPCSPPEMSFQEVATQGASYKHPESRKHLSSLSLAGTGSEEEEQSGSSQPPSRPLSPMSPLSPQPQASLATDLPSPSAGVDFSRPAHYVSCLDNSAARHRMSIRPRNQRASTKGKKPADVYRRRSSSINSMDQPLSESEEALEPPTSTEPVHHQTCSAQVTNPEEELTSPEPVSQPFTLSLQDQQEAMAEDVSSLNWNEEELKTGELFQPEDKITTNPLPLQHSDDKEPSNADKPFTNEIVVDANEENQLPTNLAPQSTSPEMVSNTTTDCNVTPIESVEMGVEDQMETPVDEDISRSKEPLARPYPIPAPRIKKPAVDRISITSPKESEKKTDLPESNSKNAVPSEGQDESTKEDNKPQRPNSFRFSVASARYRSKTISGEVVTKQQEESSGNKASLKNPSYSLDLDLQVEKVETAKTNEIPKNLISIPDKRSSLRREIIDQNISKTVVGSEDKKPEKAEESEERRGLFGIKLRTTSLSLKYRSDVAKLENKTKRRSLDAQQMAVFEGNTAKEPLSKDMEEVSKDKNSNVLTKTTPQNSDPQPDPSVDTEREATWMSLARERTRSHQASSIKLSAQPTTPPPNSTAPSTPFTSSTQPPQRPTPQPRPPLRSTNKSQLRACNSTELQPEPQLPQQTPPKPAPKGPPKPGVKSNIQTEPDVLRRTQAFGNSLLFSSSNCVPAAKPEPSSSSSSSSSSLSHQQPPSDGGQPSWMELAKRKSLAWSDKSMD